MSSLDSSGSGGIPRANLLEDLPPLPSVGPIPESDDSGWRYSEGTVVWQAHWLRVLEAFMDLTHAPLFTAAVSGQWHLIS